MLHKVSVLSRVEHELLKLPASLPTAPDAEKYYNPKRYNTEYKNNKELFETLEQFLIERINWQRIAG